MIEINLVLEGGDAKVFNYKMQKRGFKSRADYKNPYPRVAQKE